MSATTYSNSPPPTINEPPSTSKEPLALPATPHNNNNNNNSATTQLDMSSGATTVKLDHLGPMVVGVDGTLSRISNWEGMTESERESTVRIIGRRNQARLKILREKEGLGGS